jgi:uncharacterized protein
MDMKKPIVIRKRIIPDEAVDISGDVMVFRDDHLLITEWKPIKKRQDIFGGRSFTFLKEGYKISQFLGEKGELLYWYCDIIEVEYNENEDRYVLTDLLVDVKVMPDGRVLVLDVDELSDVLEDGRVGKEQASKALRILSKLLEMAYEGYFPPKICLT